MVRDPFGLGYQSGRMPRVLLHTCGAILLVAPMTWAQPAAQPATKASPDDVVVVEAEGEGMDKEHATRAALRAALERGGKVEIFSETKVENFQLVHDTILSRALGLVTDFKVLEERKIVGGTWKVKIRAQVSRSLLRENWAAIQNLLNQIGRPKIMVNILETIDGKPEEQSILETKIEERLLQSGFDLVARTATDVTRHRELDDAVATNNVARMQTLAKDNEAHIFIVGTANAHAAGVEELYGVRIAFYNCDVQLKAYYTDSARILASKGIPVTRGGAQGHKEFSPQAGKMALNFAGQTVVNDLYAQVMEQWATQITGGGELIFEIAGADFKVANGLRKALAELKGVNSVNMKLTKGIASFHINARMSAQDLAERLTEGEFDRLIEILDLKLNRIQGKVRGEATGGSENKGEVKEQ
ncbi:MAG TPA: hypothetical protein PKY77_00400 [Phycisphaerae bacterium]|nr:hypothetical protein [Phycisphaerae bacterium]HRY67687.1 hypothetical protein [Phycisphaerae bacterium]